MAGFDEKQKQWIIQFLSTIGQNAAAGLTSPPSSPGGLPFDKTAPAPLTNVLSGAVNSAAPTPPAGYDGPPPNGQPNAPVSEAEVVAAYRGNPEVINYSQRTAFHEDIWVYLGNKGPSPVAYRVGNTIRVDIERFPAARLPEIGIHPRTTPITTVRTGGTGPAAPDVEQGNTQQGPAPVDPNAKTGEGTPPAKPASPHDTLPADGSGTLGDPAPKGGPKTTPWNAHVKKIEPVEALKMSQTGNNVYTSESGKSHQEAWEFHGQEGTAPIAYQVDNDVYVNLERWPEDLHLPEKHYPRGTKRVAPQNAQNPAKPKQPSTPADKDSHAPAGSSTSAQDPNTPATSASDAEKLQKQADEYARKVEQLNEKFEKLNKQSGSGQNPEKERSALQKEADALNAEAEALATKIVSLPELEGFRASTPSKIMENLRSRFGGGGVRGKVEGIALTIMNAYYIAQDIKYIFQADTALEGAKRAFQAGESYLEGAAEVEVLALVTRSTPVAVAITIIISEEDRESADNKRKRLRNLAIAQFVQSISPGAVDTSDNTVRVIDQRLWDATVNKINQMRKDFSTGETKKLGISDGLVGSSANKGNFKPTDEDDDAKVTQQDLDAGYQAGVKIGQAQRANAIKYFHDTGYQDGSNGKPANANPSEHSTMAKDVVQLRDNRDGDVKVDAIGTLNEFTDVYKKGYAEGQKTFQSQDAAKLEITPSSFSRGAYTTQKLTVNSIYPDGRKVDVSDKVTWHSDKPEIVAVGERWAKAGTSKGGGEIRQRDGVQASLLAAGKATITAEYQSGSHKLTAKVTIAVTEPKIAITAATPLVATYTGPGKYMAEVGKTQQFIGQAAAGDHWDDLLPTFLTWEAKPPGFISIDHSGNATMVKEGNATITVTDTKSKATAKIEFSVRAGRFLGSWPEIIRRSLGSDKLVG